MFADAIEERKQVLEIKEMEEKIEKEKIDITLDGQKPNLGNLHPLMLIQQEIEDLFIGLGYTVAEGPEVEEDFYNFERANIPKDHPARDMQDTFYINEEELLRTHTTAVQCANWNTMQNKIAICQSRSSAQVRSIAVMMMMQRILISLCSVKVWLSQKASPYLI